jgi:hypothetical protein
MSFPFSCDKCDATFKSNAELEYHKKYDHLFLLKKEEETDIMKFVKNMILKHEGKINKLESNMKLLEQEVHLLKVENSQLKARMNIRINKNIRDILNHSIYHGTLFRTWIFSFDITKDHLNMVYDEDLSDTIKQIFSENIQCKNEIPIRAFIEKKNVLYYYNGNGWQIMDKDIQLIYPFVTKLGMLYSQWCQEMGEMIETNQSIQQRSYIHLTKITMNGEKVEKIIREWLYQQLKQPIYDFV